MESEEVIRVGRQLVDTSAPKSVHISAEHRQELPPRNHCGVPAGNGIKGRIETHFPSSHSEERQDVPGPLAWSTLVVFVFDLNSDDGATIFPEKPLRLPADLFVEAANIAKITRVALPGGASLKQPIGKAAIAYFTVRPGPNPDPNVHHVLGNGHALAEHDAV